MGHGDTKYVTLEEQLAIFLYTSVTGLSIRHVGERFQRANGTISKCVLQSLVMTIYMLIR
jgi:transposase